MSAIGAISGAAAAQAGQASQVSKPVDHDGDHDNNKPDPPMEAAKEARAVSQHRVDVNA